MADQNTVFRGPDTHEAFLADRMRVWGAFNKVSVGVVVFVVALLLFLLIVVY